MKLSDHIIFECISTYVKSEFYVLKFILCITSNSNFTHVSSVDATSLEKITEV